MQTMSCIPMIIFWCPQFQVKICLFITLTLYFLNILYYVFNVIEKFNIVIKKMQSLWQLMFKTFLPLGLRLPFELTIRFCLTWSFILFVEIVFLRFLKKNSLLSVKVIFITIKDCCIFSTALIFGLYKNLKK